MYGFFDKLLGLHADDDTVTAAQMCARAILVFFVALAQLRLSGKRTFGNDSPFDVVIKIILGAVLSRAIIAASPLGGTILASTVMVLLHRLLALAAYYYPTIGNLIKGQSFILAERGKIRYDNLRRNNLSEKDLLQGVRQAGQTDDLESIEVVHLERDGRISVVLRKNETHEDAEEPRSFREEKQQEKRREEKQSA